MYYDDPFDPLLDNDYDEHKEMSDSSSEISVSSNSKKQRKMLDEMKKADKGYHRIVRKINGRRSTIEFYESSHTPGKKIRNAVSGLYESDMLVGKLDEKLLFKVTLSTGETGQNPAHLYYDNPEQYERHFRCILQQSQKETWLQSCIAERIRLERIRDQYREASRRE